MFKISILSLILLNFTNAVIENCHKVNLNDSCTIRAKYFHGYELETPLNVLIKCHSDPKKIHTKRFSGVTSIEWNGCETVTYQGLFVTQYLNDPEPENVKNFTITSFEIHILSKNELESLKSLKTLALVNNHIRVLDKDIFEPLPHLKSLKFENNNLITVDFVKQGHPSIETLELREKSLTIEDKFENFTKLSKVILNVRALRIEVLEQLSTTLVNIEVQDTVILNLANERMTNLSLNLSEKLESLTLTGLNVTHIKIKTCNNLKTLDLTSNKLVDLNFSCTLESLRTLVLNKNNIKSVDTIEFENFPKLEEIFLKFNFIQKLDVKTFDSLKFIKVLDVSNNLLQNIEMLSGKNESINYKIIVQDNPLNCTWLMHLKNLSKIHHLQYTNNHTGINVDGLQCSNMQVESNVSHNKPFVIPISPYIVIFLVINFFFSLTMFLMQTIAYCYQSYLLHKQRHIPFYRTLGIIDNPRGDRRETYQMSTRPLPSLNYEAPIWERYRYSIASTPDVPVSHNLIYEEISEAGLNSSEIVDSTLK